MHQSSGIQAQPVMTAEEILNSRLRARIAFKPTHGGCPPAVDDFWVEGIDQALAAIKRSIEGCRGNLDYDEDSDSRSNVHSKTIDFILQSLGLDGVPND